MIPISVETEVKNLLSGLKVRAWTKLRIPVKVKILALVFKFQMIMLLSAEAEANSCLLGLKAKALTLAVCPLKVAIWAFELTFHNAIGPLLDPEAKRLPSRLKASAVAGILGGGGVRGVIKATPIVSNSCCGSGLLKTAFIVLRPLTVDLMLKLAEPVASVVAEAGVAVTPP